MFVQVMMKQGMLSGVFVFRRFLIFLLRLREFMKNGKEKLHGCEGLKHLSWIADSPSALKPTFKAMDHEMELPNKSPLYFQYLKPDAGDIPYRLSPSDAKFYTHVFKSLSRIVQVSALLIV